MTTPADERVTVGLVRGLHGLQGAVRVEVLSDDPGRFSPGSTLYADGSDEPLTITWTGPSKPGLLVRFREHPTRESAESLRDRYLEAVPGARLPDGIYYWHEVEGLEAVTRDGESLGRVVDVFRAGGGEVYVVRGGTHGEVMVPAVKSVVLELDPPSGRLVVDPVALALPEKPPRRRRRHERTREERKAARKRPGRAARRAAPEPVAGASSVEGAALVEGASPAEDASAAEHPS